MFNVYGKVVHLTRRDSADMQIFVYVDEEQTVPYEFQEGDRVFFKMRLLPEYGEVLEKECYIDFENNECFLTLEPEDTDGFAMTEYRYQVRLTDSSGHNYTIIENETFVLGKEL